MKIPPLTEMEPLPPVPSCSRDLGLDEISDNDSDFEPGPSSSSRNGSKLDSGSLLDNEIQEEVRKRAAAAAVHVGAESVVNSLVLCL